MFVLFLLIGIASLLYFAFLFTTASYLSSIWIWAVLGVLHFLLAFLYKKPAQWKKSSRFFRFKVFCFSTYLLFSLLLLGIMFFIGNYKKGNAENKPDYILLVGSELENNAPSPTMKKRLELAVEYAKENPETLLVLVGGRGRHSASAESSVMFQRLLRAGIENDRLLMEFYSKNTMDKIRFGLNSIAKWSEERYLEEEERQREKELYLQDGDYSYIKEEALEWEEDRPPNVGILSSQYELFQCTAFAEKENSFYHYQTLSAEEPLYLLPHYYLRESFLILFRRLFHQI